MTKKQTSLSSQIGIAICSLQASNDGSIQLFPAGKFDAPRGAMAGSGPWFIDEAAATALIERVSQRQNDIVIDFEHQTIKAAENGQPAPASGWIKSDSLSWVAGKGLMVSSPEWTEPAQTFINNKQYKYLSPVFSYDKSTGRVLDLFHVALTNNPAIDGMQDVVLAAASAKFIPDNQQEDSSMNEALLKLLGLKKDASEDDVLAACTALQTKNTELAATNTDLAKKVADSETAIAAASAATPESALTVITELQSTCAALTARLDGSDMDTLIAAAKAGGKLTPVMEPWARSLPVASLKSYLETAPQIAALTATQTGNKQKLDSDGKAVLTDEQIAVCSQMGISQAEFLKTLAEEA
tara:strand:- start:44697 stop:45761 length:1065 start_codon:yes stop_codon:yes gene_type:complete